MAEKMGKYQFSQTCSLLSQFLKEKGSFGSIGLEMAPRPLHHHQPPKDKSQAPTTLSLLPGVRVSGEEIIEQPTPKSMDLFPQQAGFDSPAKGESSFKAPSNNTQGTDKAQLTIFYNGKVLVFDDFPDHKARDLIQMAGKESIPAPKLGFAVPASSSMATECPAKLNPIFAPRAIGQQQQAAAGVGAVPPQGPQHSLPTPAQANASDMPIARRNSLHRFLEKRKDRINTKAPYQVHGDFPAQDAADVKPEDVQPWLGLGRQAVKQEHDCESSR